MTRFLSEALEAPEPFFRLGLRRLEAANGHPSTDIRFSTEVKRATQEKLKQLGLDPRDTTAEELYQVLQERIKADDAQLTKTLRTRAATHVSAEGDVVAGMIHALRELPDSKRCFALKPSVLKAIIKKSPPKKAVKQLGYRSLDSFIKHEPPVSMLAAAWLSEGTHWQHRLLEQYKRLKPSDFEDRKIALVQLDSKRWQSLTESTVSQNKHNLLSFKELGTLVFLPLPSDAPNGSTTVSLALALHELNEIRAGSTFLKLCQVRPDFGSIVQTVVSDEPHLNSQLLDQPVPWHLIQRYYAQLTHHASEEVFEPHLQLEDIAWHPIEQTLKAIEPSFDFWQHSAHLGLLHGRQPVSLNVVDAALNYCNQLPFERRIVQHFQRSLWHELLLRYLRHEPVEQTVLAELQPQLAAEAVLV
jgi:hypothetical protein